MTEEETGKEDRQLWVTIVACVLVIMMLLVLYVLSAGPVAVLFLRTESRSVGIAAYLVYLPLMYSCDQCDSVAEVVFDYLEFWCEITDTDFPEF